MARTLLEMAQSKERDQMRTAMLQVGVSIQDEANISAQVLSYGWSLKKAITKKYDDWSEEGDRILTALGIESN